jgi:hypothetical protein
MGSSTVRQAGNSDNTIMVLSGGIFVWTGGIAGPCSWEGRWVIHSLGDPLKEATNTVGYYTIEATVDGKQGTLVIEAKANTNSPHHPNWVIISGTGELANLHGQGTFTGSFPVWNYVGQVHFDP